tara:strand:- start:165 stop:383 length:219 start_codon:yes stop_codon:yes gene_type:complete
VGDGVKDSRRDGRVWIWSAWEGGFCREHDKEEAFEGVYALYEGGRGSARALGEWKECEGLLQWDVLLEGDEE